MAATQARDAEMDGEASEKSFGCARRFADWPLAGRSRPWGGALLRRSLRRLDERAWMDRSDDSGVACKIRPVQRE
jgi:hypothetical protein